MFLDDVYEIENSRSKFSQKIKINMFIKVSKYKVNVGKLISLLYPSNKQIEN